MRDRDEIGRREFLGCVPEQIAEPPVDSEESPVEAMNLLLEKIKKTENNIEFLMGLNVKNK